MVCAASMPIAARRRPLRSPPLFPRKTWPERDMEETLAMSSVIPALPSVILASPSVIPANAGIHPTSNPEAPKMPRPTLRLTESGIRLGGGRAQ